MSFQKRSSSGFKFALVFTTGAILAACGGGEVPVDPPTASPLPTDPSASSPTTPGTPGTPPTPESPLPDSSTSQTSSPIKATLQATRTGGVAPLAVLFDATATTTTTPGTDTFRQLSYSFDFGDERGAAWPVSGQPKNQQTGGPIAAHVFDQPGTYTVKVKATDASGASAETTLTINVQSADAAYAGTQTVCVSPSANYTGCPAGALRQTALPSLYHGKRVLLRRGESFGAITITDGNTGVIVGGYGAGALPLVDSVSVGAWRPSTPNFATDITVMDLKVGNGMTQSVGKRVLFYRNELTSQGSKNGIYFGGIKYWAGDDPHRKVAMTEFYQPREIFLVENTVVGSVTGDKYNVFGDGSHIALLGNVMGTSGEHTVRLTSARKAIVAHNELRGISNDGRRHSLKIHSGGMTPYDDRYSVSSYKWISEQVVVSHNVFGHPNSNNQWTVALSPQNNEYTEGLQHFIIANNHFIRTASVVQDLTLGGRDFTIRGNTVSNGESLRQGTGHTGGLPAEWVGPFYTN